MQGTLAVRRQVEIALELVGLAADALRAGVSREFAMLHDAAEQCHSRILAGICSLTDEEADLIEPLFTKLETGLGQFKTSFPGKRRSASGLYNAPFNSRAD